VSEYPPTTLPMKSPLLERIGPLPAAALAWIAGTALALACAPPPFAPALGALGLLAAALGANRSRPGLARALAFAGLVLGAGAWAGHREAARLGELPKWAGREPRLLRVTGTVVTLPRVRVAESGPFAPYDYRPPRTDFELDVSSLEDGGGRKPVTGRLRVRIADLPEAPGAGLPAVERGDRVRATGWLRAPPARDRAAAPETRATWRRLGLTGTLVLPAAGNLERLARGGGWRGRLREAARSALVRGFEHRPGARALVTAILLGDRRHVPPETTEAFRRSGLAHLLAISGAHLGILVLGLVWLTAAVWDRPQRAALATLLLLGLYLLVVEPRVPVMRAGLMAAFWLGARSSGLPIRPIDPLAMAAILLLAWRPAELAGPGFQLSFIVVTALVLFVPALAARLAPRPEPEIEPPGRTAQVRRRLAEYAAVSLVAFLAASPLIAWHFGLVSPWAAILSPLAIPLVGFLVAGGLLKILLGLLAPGAGVLLAGPLAWGAELLAGMAETGTRLPAGWIELARPAPAAWALAALGTGAAAGFGWFRGRPLALAASLALLAGWLAIRAAPAPTPWLRLVGLGAPPPALRIDALPVGDGTSMILRAAAPGGRQRAALWECGSRSTPNVGRHVVVPELKRAGVRRLDFVAISHAHFDHYSGLLDVAEAVPVGRVLLPPTFLERARARPGGSAARLLECLAARGIPVEIARAGWRGRLGRVRLRALWPPGDGAPANTNDGALVFSLRVAGRRVLLTGDVEQEALTALMAREPSLGADVLELPHHGSPVPASPELLARVRPRLVLESGRRDRLEADPWPQWLARWDARRLATAEVGTARVTIDARGRITAGGFKTGRIWEEAAGGRSKTSPRRRAPPRTGTRPRRTPGVPPRPAAVPSRSSGP